MTIAMRQTGATAARVFAVPAMPSAAEYVYLQRGLGQAGGKLPLFDLDGQAVEPQMVDRCLAMGWAERWFVNPLKPDWLVCKLTDKGRALVQIRS